MSSFSSLRDNLRSVLPTDANRRFIIAYSGGIDSQVLLHLMAAVVAGEKYRLLMVHVDHGLHKDSRAWAKWCVGRAAALDIEAAVLKVNETPPPGHSVEAWARGHRYRLLQSIMQSDDVILTAHHRSDLIETFLLQLFRGTGPHGLASIAERQRFGPGLLLRPLLSSTRADIMAYAEAHRLEWLDDPSNLEDRFDRNYLRNRIMPQIEQRWPAVNARIAHAVELQQFAAACLDEAADAVLESVLGTENSQLPISSVTGLSSAMQRCVLRRWIVRAGFPIPDAVHLREMQRLVRARADAQPCVRWKRAELKRYRDELFLFWHTQRIASHDVYHWNFGSALHLPGGVLSAHATVGRGLSASLAASNDVVVRFRSGGERCHPVERAHSQSLKRLFQEWGTPPWVRGEIPLVFYGDELAAVVDNCVCRGFAAKSGEAGWILRWTKHAERAETALGRAATET